MGHLDLNKVPECKVNASDGNGAWKYWAEQFRHQRDIATVSIGLKFSGLRDMLVERK